MSASFAAAAFRLARRGVSVFPLAPRSKVPPAGTHGSLEASCDPDVARARWARAPRANVAIATGKKSGIWVLDVDPRHGGDVALANLEKEHGPLPLTVEVLTPSGGRHLYFRWSASGLEIRNSAGRVGPGLDVRGEGGSVVCPPSVLADGRRYAWAGNGARGFADAPAWLVKLTQQPPPPRTAPADPPDNVERYVAAAVTAELRNVEDAAEGTRNDQLNRASFNVAQFVAVGAVPDDWARSQLEARAVNAGLSATEARRTIESGFRAGLAHPRELPR